MTSRDSFGLSPSETHRSLRQQIYDLLQQRVFLRLLFLTVAFLSGYIYDLNWEWPTAGGILNFVPWLDLWSAFLTVTIIDYVYEIHLKHAEEEKISEAINKALEFNRENIIRDLPRSLIFDKDQLRRIYTDENIGLILRTALAVKVGDDQLGNDIYDSTVRNASEYSERWSAFKYAVTLSQMETPEFAEKLFQVYVSLSYETILSKTEFLFTCARTTDEYNELLKDPKYQTRWLLPLDPGAYEDLFKVEFVKIGGRSLDLARKFDEGGRFVISATSPSLQEMLGEKTKIAYRYKTAILKSGHLLAANLVNPTNGVSFSFDFAGTGLEHVSVFDFFDSKNIPRIQYLPTARPHKIEVEIDGWVLPKSGVIFVW